MATTNITIRMDEELKKQAEEVFSDLGLNMTTAFTAFATSAVMDVVIASFPVEIPDVNEVLRFFADASTLEVASLNTLRNSFIPFSPKSPSAFPNPLIPLVFILFMSFDKEIRFPISRMTPVKEETLTFEI